jgi:hypothetical protein
MSEAPIREVKRSQQTSVRRNRLPALAIMRSLGSLRVGEWAGFTKLAS